jgi:hypothetical protein
MSVEEVFSELRKLDRADKLRAMQLLVTELASGEQSMPLPSGQYEVWSPYDAASAALTLTSMLGADHGVSSNVADKANKPAALERWLAVYDGLSAEDVAEVEQIALDRSGRSRARGDDANTAV